MSLIKGEMLNNFESVKKEKNNLAKSINSQRKIIELMHDEVALDTIPEHILSQIMLPAISLSIAVNNEDGILSELIASGSLKDIENDSIKNVLSSWEGKVYQLREQEKSLRELWIKNNNLFESIGFFRTIFDQTNYSDYVEINKLESFKSNKHVLSSTEYENILLIQLATSRHLETRVYPDFEKEILNLISLIEYELINAIK